MEQNIIIVPRSSLQSAAKSRQPLPGQEQGYNIHLFAGTFLGCLQNWLGVPNNSLQVVAVYVNRHPPDNSLARCIILSQRANEPFSYETCPTSIEIGTGAESDAADGSLRFRISIQLDCVVMYSDCLV